MGPLFTVMTACSIMMAQCSHSFGEDQFGLCPAHILLTLLALPLLLTFLTARPHGAFPPPHLCCLISPAVRLAEGGLPRPVRTPAGAAIGACFVMAACRFADSFSVRNQPALAICVLYVCLTTSPRLPICRSVSCAALSMLTCRLL